MQKYTSTLPGDFSNLPVLDYPAHQDGLLKLSFRKTALCLGPELLVELLRL